jgi:hypothetical protein
MRKKSNKHAVIAASVGAIYRELSTLVQNSNKSSARQGNTTTASH